MPSTELRSEARVLVQPHPYQKKPLVEFDIGATSQIYIVSESIIGRFFSAHSASGDILEKINNELID